MVKSKIQEALILNKLTLAMNTLSRPLPGTNASLRAV